MRVFLLVACLGLASVSVNAAEWKTSFGAEVDLEALSSFEKVGPDNKTLRGIGTARLPSTIRYGRRYRLRFLPYVQWDPQNVSKKEQFYWDAQEAYFQWQNLPWTLQVGYNTITWGDTDVFNPLDVVSARRYFDPLRAEKMGAPMLLLKRDFESFFLEALYIPKQRRTLIPGENSRWLPRDIYQDRTIVSAYGTGRVLLPADLNYTYADAVEMDHPFRNNFGVRAKFRFSGFDWTVAGFQGLATAPSVTIRRIRLSGQEIDPVTGLVTLVAQPDVTLRAVYYQTRMTGTSFVWVLGDYLAKGAIAYTKAVSALEGNPKSYLPPDIWEAVLGVERTFALGDGSLTALAQGTYVDRGGITDNNTVSLSRMFDRAVMAGLRWAPSEKVTVLASYLRDIQYKGSFLHGEFAVKLRDGVKAKISSDILGGGTETPLGTYRRNDRVTLALNGQW